MMSLNRLMLVVLVVVPLSSALLGGQLDSSPRVYCGRALARMIAVICFDAPPDKRSEIGTMYGGLIPPYYKEDSHNMWPWAAPKHSALGNIRGKRLVGGVADECCDKPCSINELSYYC